MKVRIVVKPSKVANSTLWGWDVEEKFGDKWRMAYVEADRPRFYSGISGDRDLAIKIARKAAQSYIKDRKIYPHAIHKDIIKLLTYTEEINVEA